MKYFFRKSVENSIPEEITRNMACRLLENTYGQENDLLIKLEKGEGTNVSVYDGQIYIEGR